MLLAADGSPLGVQVEIQTAGFSLFYIFFDRTCPRLKPRLPRYALYIQIQNSFSPFPPSCPSPQSSPYNRGLLLCLTMAGKNNWLKKINKCKGFLKIRLVSKNGFWTLSLGFYFWTSWHAYFFFKGENGSFWCDIVSPRRICFSLKTWLRGNKLHVPHVLNFEHLNQWNCLHS